MFINQQGFQGLPLQQMIALPWLVQKLWRRFSRSLQGSRPHGAFQQMKLRHLLSAMCRRDTNWGMYLLANLNSYCMYRENDHAYDTYI